MIKHFIVSLFALFSLAGCEQKAEPTSSQSLNEGGTEPNTAVVYEGARLIVGDGSEAIENAVFVVDNGRFIMVGAVEDIPVSPGATRIDLAGMTVMPVIIDAHTHLNITRDALINDLKRRAYFGVGAALSLGADGEGTPLEIRSESIPGAAVYRSAGVGITSPEPGRREVHWVTSEEQARQAVRTEVARNVDMIKIWVDDRNGEFEKLSPELYAAVIDEAHQNGLKVAAHIFALEDAKNLLRADVDIFAHGVRDLDLDDEFMELVKAHPNAVLIPNMNVRGVATDYDWLSGAIPAEELQSLQARAADQPASVAEFFAIQARNLDRLNKAGMTIAFGTDGNNPWIPHVEMEDMVAAGMTPAEVLVAATQTAAEVMDLTDMGTVAVGKSADFIVLKANPLDDITNTRQIDSVYLRGEQVDRSSLPE